MKLYPYPQARMHLAAPKGWEPLVNGPLPSKYWDHSTRVIRWMGRNALRRLHEYRKQNQAFPSPQDLQKWILRITEYREVDSYFRDSEGNENVEKIERMALEAAAFALEAWDEEEYEAIVERARNGGKKSRRAKKFTLADFQALPAGLSISQQAKALGCSVRTVSTLRKEFENMWKVAEDKANDELLARPTLHPVTLEDNPKLVTRAHTSRQMIDQFLGELLSGQIVPVTPLSETQSATSSAEMTACLVDVVSNDSHFETKDYSAESLRTPDSESVSPAHEQDSYILPFVNFRGKRYLPARRFDGSWTGLVKRSA